MAKLEAVLKPCNYCVHSSGTRAMHACHALWPCTVPICSYCAESTPPQEVEGARFPLPAHVLRNPEKGLSACADRAAIASVPCTAPYSTSCAATSTAACGASGLHTQPKHHRTSPPGPRLAAVFRRMSHAGCMP